MLADSQHISLTPGESQVLGYLESRPGCIVAYEEFAQIGVSFRTGTFNLANFISQIRRKVPSVEIYNIHGVGYMLKRKGNIQ
jgi:DNA-binding response OmpR family regulator